MHSIDDILIVRNIDEKQAIFNITRIYKIIQNKLITSPNYLISMIKRWMEILKNLVRDLQSLIDNHR